MGRPLTEAELREYEERRRKSAEETAKLLHISVEELERMEAEARAKLDADDTWEKELDAKNRAKAGIE